MIYTTSDVDYLDSWEDEKTPEQTIKDKKLALSQSQKEHEDSLRKQRSRIRIMDRSNVVPRKRR